MCERNLNENEITEVNELNEQFVEFLKTKGIAAKAKLVVENMKKSIQTQHQIDVANFNQVKAKSIEQNREFYEFLHTKGFKAKVKLVIENIKKGASEARKNPIKVNKTINEIDLNKEFDLFLKSKGLNHKYVVKIEEIK